MTETTLRAADVPAGCEIAGWKGYTVVGYQPHPTKPSGRIVMRDRYGQTCWTPKDPGEYVTVTRKAD